MHSTVKRLFQRTPVLGSLWSSRDRALRDLAAQRVSLQEHQRSLEEHQEALARAERSLREHQSALHDAHQAFADYRTSIEGRGQELSYNSDGLMTFRKSLDFLTDSRFRRAYNRGINSGHLIGPVVNADIGIEYRVHIVLWAAHHAMQIEGDFVECGVNTGICSLAICDYLDWNTRGRTFWLFDTYCGIPESMVTDRERALGATDHFKRAYFECYELVQNNFRSYTGIEIVRGVVPRTLSQFTGGKVAYLSIDMNIVEPEIAAIEFFWDRLEKSAIVVLDDYGWDARRLQKEAFDDFAKRKGIMIATLPTGQGLIVK
jgi:O-methyltransferase